MYVLITETREFGHNDCSGWERSSYHEDEYSDYKTAIQVWKDSEFKDGPGWCIESFSLYQVDNGWENAKLIKSKQVFD